MTSTDQPREESFGGTAEPPPSSPLSVAALLRTTLEHIDQGLMMIDAEGRVQVTNRRVATLLDLSPDFIASKPSFEDIKAYQNRKGEFAKAGEAFRSWLEHGDLHTCDARYERERPDGTILEIQTSFLPDRSVVRTYTDVTKRCRAEAALRDTTALLNATLENMDQGLMMIDGKGVVQVCNEQAIRLLGLPRDLMRNKPDFADVIAYQKNSGEFTGATEEKDPWLKLKDDLLSAPPVYERARPDGTVLEVRTVRLQDGGAVRTFTDLTARKRQEAALAESEALHRLLAENAVDMIGRTSLGGVRLYVSPAVRDLLGYEPEQLVGSRPTDLVHPDDVAKLEPMLQALREGRLDRAEYLHRIRHADGRWIWCEVRFRLVRDPVSGTPRELVTVTRDVGKRVEAEAALRASQSRNRALADALPQMVWLTRTGTGETLYVNRTYSEYYGEIGRTRADRVARNHPDDAARMAEAWACALAAGQTFEVEGRLLRRDGVYRWHKLVMNPIRRDGEIVEWLGTALDIDDVVRDQEALRETTALVRLAQEGAGAGLFEWDLNSGEGRLSVESLRLFGLPPDRDPVVAGAEWERLIDERDLPAIYAEAERAARTGTSYRTEFRTHHPDGSERWVLGIGRLSVDGSQGAERIVGLNLDVTERKAAEEALRLREAELRTSEERLALALEAAAGGLWDWSIPTGALWLNEGWHRMLGLSPGDVAPHVSSWEALVHPDDRASTLSRLQAHLDGDTPAFEAEYRVRHADGTWIWTFDRGRVVARGDDGKPTRMIGVRTDITPRKEAERRAEYQARHDGLTTLPNRTYFRERLKQSASEAKRRRSSFGLLLLDLDRFKVVNDTLGHQTGDALLKQVAKRMQALIRAEDVLARLGGDEFALLLARSGSPDAARHLAERLVEAISQPFHIRGQAISIGLSVGICLAPEDGTDADTLLKNADLALYRAKGAGRSTYRFYEPSMDAAQQERQLLELDLRRALAKGEFTLHYQPQMDLASGDIAGFEALVRWNHPKRGLIPPDQFISVAEDTKQIVPLGEWVLQQACREAASWPVPLRVSVNISAVQFRQSKLIQTVISALAASGLPASRLELEVTETVLINEGEALQTLHQLRALGIRIALDDFGTGYSSLSYLRRFPFDRIKIDRSFVRDIDNEDTAAIVRAMVGLGQRLGMTITAEGVETVEQMERVHAEGCTEVQGYLVSPPAPIEEALALVVGRERIRAA